MHVQIQVGISQLYTWAHSAMLHPPVHNCVFNTVGDELRMAKEVRIYRRINLEGSFSGHILGPIHLLYLLIDIVCILRFECRDRHQYTRSCTQTEVCGIKHSLVACERHSSTFYLYVVGTQFNQLACEYLLQALERFCQHLKFCLHN